MKIYQLIIFTSLVICILNSCYKDTDISRASHCTSRSLDAGEKLLGQKYCCYFYTKNGNDVDKKCVGITQSRYDDILSYIESYEQTWGVTVMSLDCKSSYLQIGLLGLLFLLF